LSLKQSSSYKVDNTEELVNNLVPVEEGLNRLDVLLTTAKRLDRDLSDGTGMYDLASLRSGSSVIRKGPRGTSPSLHEELPVGNRVLGSLGLRFLGHGPEVALLPTDPPGSFGQCWSFGSERQRLGRDMLNWRSFTTGGIEEKIARDNDPDRGAYATLTTRLSQPTRITGVMVEHPLPDETDNEAKSAIRNFRLTGFIEADASGQPWPLGTFHYDIGSNVSIQEFKVNFAFSGRQLPKMQSITLGIDDNWGAEYSCLYRFRVHGTE